MRGVRARHHDGETVSCEWLGWTDGEAVRDQLGRSRNVGGDEEVGGCTLLDLGAQRARGVETKGDGASWVAGRVELARGGQGRLQG